MSIEVINAEKFKSDIFDYTKEQEFSFSGNKPVVLNFFAVWCGPCQVFAPALEDLAQNYSQELSVYKVDIDQNPEIPALFGIRSVPSTVFFMPGQEPALATGNMGSDGLTRAVQEIFGLTSKDI